MARAEFEAFTQSLLMNYRRVPARADPPRARCLEVKRIEKGSLADRILLSPGDLLVSINGMSAGTLSPKLWRSPAKIREYIWYCPASRERIELTSTGIDPGCELRRTPEMIKATYKPESRDSEPLLELWEAGAWDTLAALAGAVVQKEAGDTPALGLYGAALCETGQMEEGRNLVARYVQEFAEGWTTDFRGVCLYYLGLQHAEGGDLGRAVPLLQAAWAATSAERVVQALVDLGQPRPAPLTRWAGQVGPGDYELTTLEGERKVVTMSEALLGLGEGQLLLLCLLSRYRGNGPYEQFTQRYRGFARDFKPFIGGLHVITEVRERYPDRPYYFETEDRLRAEKIPFELLFDPDGSARAMYQPTVSPFVMALDSRGRVLCEGELDGLEMWRAVVAANA